jgi:hypothetical protein
MKTLAKLFEQLDFFLLESSDRSYLGPQWQAAFRRDRSTGKKYIWNFVISFRLKFLQVFFLNLSRSKYGLN